MDAMKLHADLKAWLDREWLGLDYDTREAGARVLNGLWASARNPAVIEYLHSEKDGEFWLYIRANREMWAQLGPFETASERQRAHDDMLKMMRSIGAKDIPNADQ